MKKIAFLVNSFGGGGAERNIKYLIDCLVSKYDVHVIVLEDKWAYEIPDSVKKHVLFRENGLPTFVRVLLIPIVARRLRKLSDIHHFDLVISFLARSNLIACYAKRKGLSTPLIISERVSTLSLYSSGLKGLIGRSLIKRLYQYADLIVPNAYRIRFELQNYFGITSQIKVVYNPVDIDFIIKRSNDAFPGVFDTSRFTFINVGRLAAQKNQTVLLEAFEAFRDTNCQLVLMGDGPDRAKLERKISELRLESCVFILPFQSNPYNLLKNADCFVLSSDYEGFPNVILEALACELPVISTDCSSGPREIIAPQTNFEFTLQNGIEIADFGLLVPVANSQLLAESMRKLYENAELRGKYVKNSLNRAYDFNLRKQLAEFTSLIDATIN